MTSPTIERRVIRLEDFARRRRQASETREALITRIAAIYHRRLALFDTHEGVVADLRSYDASAADTLDRLRQEGALA